MNRKIGIVILNYNTYEDTIECINSIKNHVTCAYNIYIVDNDSKDHSGQQLKEYYQGDDGIEVIFTNKNRGFSGGNNLGIAQALADQCEYVFLLNSDIILLNDAISPMMHLFESDENVVVVGPSVVNKNNQYVQFAKKGLTLSSYLFDKKGVEKLFRKRMGYPRCYKYNKKEDFIFAGMVDGCCFALKADFIKEQHCLDSNVFMYYEEDILSYLVADNHKKAALSATALVRHNQGASTQKTNANKQLFVRFYRWTSALYVLKNYVHVNKCMCYIVAGLNIVSWLLLSIRNKEYRKTLRKFIKECKRALTLKVGSNLYNKR